MRILLVRHGQSQANVNGRIQGPDDPLTDLGHDQARLLGPHLAEQYEIDHLVTSSLHRAHETASIIAESTGHDITFDPRFAEIMNGHAVGMLWTDWREANSELAAVWGWDVRHADAGWAGGESGRDVCNRAFGAWDELVQKYAHTSETIAIVSHGGVIAWLAARINGDDLEYWPARYGDIANCSITEVDISRDGIANMHAWNQVDHLGAAFAPHVSPVIPDMPEEKAPS